MHIVGEDFNVVDFVLRISSVLSSGHSPWSRLKGDKKEEEEIINRRRMKFFSPLGDHISYLKVFNDCYERRDKLDIYCTQYGLDIRCIKRVFKIYDQLKRIHETAFNREPDRIKLVGRDDASFTKTRQAFLSGFYLNSAKKQMDSGYIPIGQINNEQEECFIHPSSTLSKQTGLSSHSSTSSPWIFYNESVITSKTYLRDCTIIDDAKWIENVAPSGLLDSHDNVPNLKLQPLFRRGEEEEEWRLKNRYMIRN